MTTAVKYFLLIINNKKARNTIIGIVIGVIAAVLFLLMFTYESTQQNAAPIAEKAKEEYSFWQTHTPNSQNLSCQGERYCSYFKSSVTDWCCYLSVTVFRNQAMKPKILALHRELLCGQTT